MDSPSDSPKRYGLFVFAAVLILLAAGVNIFYFNDNTVRRLSLSVCLLGVILVKVSNVRGIKELLLKKKVNSENQ
jgi:hypothetical protein